MSWGAGVAAALPANASAAHPQVGNVSHVFSVSCSSPGNCTAVGNYVDTAGDYQGLLLTETAGSWSIGVEAALPANAVAHKGWDAEVRSVSCSSAGNCGAVGFYTDGSGAVEGLLLTETAGHWSTGVEADLPAGSRSVELKSISCPSAGNCSAVGLLTPWNLAGPQEGVLLTETAGVWGTGVEVALPAGAYEVDAFGSVSCASAGNCVAVGAYANSSGMEFNGYGTHSLLVTETGGQWGPGVEAPLPADATAGQMVGLSSVSCASAGNCTAVGFYNGTYHAVTCDPKYGCVQVLEAKGLLLTETAGVWQAVSASLPASANAVSSVGAVSCASPGNCSAVGISLWDDSSGAYPTEQGLLLTETDGSWATGVQGAKAGSVSCVSPGNCGAVGGHLITQTAGTWGPEVNAPLPADATAGVGLSSVSCTSDGSCAAAGDYEHNVGFATDIEGMVVGGTPPAVELHVATDGTGSGSVSSDVGGIDCGSSCAASFDAGAAVTLTATPSPGSRFVGWSGICAWAGTDPCHPDTALSEQTVTATFGPLPWGAAAAVPGAAALNVGGNGQVTSISCAGAKTCAAGGYYRDGRGSEPFVADETSGSWGTAVKVPGIASLSRGRSASVNSVSCASPGNCAAGGYYSVGKGGYDAFVVDEANGSWRKAVKVPGLKVLNTGKNAQVTSISCAGPGKCEAGGSYVAGKARHRVFVVSEKNGGWGKAITVPGTGPLNAGGNASLNSISCGSPGNCAAGGYYSDGKGGRHAFVVHEKRGVWGKATKVPVVEALNVGLNAQVVSVSCTSASYCAAGGTYQDGSGSTQSFVVSGGPVKKSWTWGKAIIVPGTAAARHVSGFARLTSISCTGDWSCSAAGQFSSPDGNQAFVVSGGNGGWDNATEVPGIAGLASTSNAIAISCVSTGHCAVTGSDNASPGVFTALQTNSVSNNGVWENATSLYGLNGLAVSGSSHVTSISCAPTGSCAIGGSYDDGSLHAQPFVTSP